MKTTAEISKSIELLEERIKKLEIKIVQREQEIDLLIKTTKQMSDNLITLGNLTI